MIAANNLTLLQSHFSERVNLIKSRVSLSSLCSQRTDGPVPTYEYIYDYVIAGTQFEEVTYKNPQRRYVQRTETPTNVPQISNSPFNKENIM